MAFSLGGLNCTCCEQNCVDFNGDPLGVLCGTCCMCHLSTFAFANGLFGNGSVIGVAASGKTWRACYNFTSTSIEMIYSCVAGSRELQANYWNALNCTGSITATGSSTGAAPNRLTRITASCPGDLQNFDRYGVDNTNCPGLFAVGFRSFTLSC